MALFESGNPTLSEKIFTRSSLDVADTGAMTVRGTMNKFGFLMLMLMAAAGYTWHLFYQGKESTVMTLLWVGLIGGFILSLIICFKPTTSRYLAPAHGILEGLFIGAVSAMLNNAFAASYPDIIIHAVALTLTVGLSMFLLYHFKVIKVTERFRSIIISATMGIAVFYLIGWILALFGVSMSFMSISNSTPLGIGISLFIVAIAALNLILDFDMIERGAQSGAPKYMEWYGAFGLLITIVWLYLEILKLLARFAGRR